MKTLELTGPALDWAVAKCEGMRIEVRPKSACGRPLYVLAAEQGREPWLWYPSTSWAQGGPIIEREGISVAYIDDNIADGAWFASTVGGDENNEGPTPLIAAMRCYVASKLGDGVTIPEELA